MYRLGHFVFWMEGQGYLSSPLYNHQPALLRGTCVEGLLDLAVNTENLRNILHPWRNKHLFHIGCLKIHDTLCLITTFTFNEGRKSSKFNPVLYFVSRTIPF